MDKHRLYILGDGVFGSFLRELLAPHFELREEAPPRNCMNSLILAVPAHAYRECARLYKDAHLVNVCSVQQQTTKDCLLFTNAVTSIHPLFGRRTPADKRNSILTRSMYVHHDDSWYQPTIETKFMAAFSNVTSVVEGITPEEHDKMMAKTHLAALMAAQQLKVYTDRAKDIPDNMIPHSFRLMREFVKTLDDMPQGTVESILSNPLY